MTEPKTVALVTGANKGLGRETVRQLAYKGWQVFLAARDRERGSRAAEELAKEGAEVEFVELDVTSDESVAAAVKAVSERVDQLDVLVNNAACRRPDAESGRHGRRRPPRAV